jgi:hypothetical protein
MFTSLRRALIDSHVAAIAIATLLAASVGEAVILIAFPAARILSFLIVAIATNNIPYVPNTMDFAAHQLSLQNILVSLLIVFTNLAAAWLLCRWVYGAGLLCTMASYRGRISRKTHA